jgi:hypothetical protein
MCPFRAQIGCASLLVVIIRACMQAVPLLASITFILIASIFVFSLIGMQLFSQTYHHACLDDMNGEQEAVGLREMGQWGCGVRKCPQNYTCTIVSTEGILKHNVAGFDNIGAAMLTSFQVR